MIRTRALVVPAVAAALLLAACQSASHGGADGGGTADGGDHDGYQNDPWLTDDTEMDAILATGEYQGLTMVGLSCDQDEGFVADSEGPGDGPSAGIVITPEDSIITWFDGQHMAADGDGAGSPTNPGSVTVSFDGKVRVDDGGGQPWSSTATLTVRSVPVPPDNGCTVADMWVTSMIDAETPGDEVFRAMTENGLVVAPAECTTQYGFQWLPPNMSCGDVAEQLGR